MEHSLVMQEERSLAGWCVRHHARLLTRIRRMMGPEVREALESSDVLQSVVVSALRQFPFPERESANLLGWMTTAARHRIVDEARRQRERRIGPLTCEPLGGGDSSIATALARHEGRAELACGLAELDADRRRVVELRTFEGHSWGGIALEFGRSEEAVRKLYHRALLQLGSRLTRGRSG